jgi:hypothetical protein
VYYNTGTALIHFKNFSYANFFPAEQGTENKLELPEFPHFFAPEDLFS